jgi:TolB protein
MLDDIGCHPDQADKPDHALRIRGQSEMNVFPAALTIGFALLLLHAGPSQYGVTQLTRSGARNGQAFVSPDGMTIAFVSDRSGSWQVWVMPSEGGDARQVTNAGRPVGWPSWELDGDAILLYMGTDDGYRLHRVEVESGVVSRINDEGFEDFRPTLSPDGRSMLFDRSGTSDPPNHDLFVRQLATSSIRQLTSDPGYDSDGRWSPDGTRIVFHSDRGASRAFATQVYIMQSDGSGIRRLTDGPAIHGYPSWSPDGRYLAYTAELDGDREIWVMSATGSWKARVTRSPGFDGEPVWMPGDPKLLFTTDRFGGRELALIDVGPLLRLERANR